MQFKSDFMVLIDQSPVHIHMVSYRRFTQVLPAHAHGEHIYEIHYITSGYGTLILNHISYDLCPGILYLTGPGVLHEQIPDASKSLTEFGMYAELHYSTPVLSAFYQNPSFLGHAPVTLDHVAKALLSEYERAQPGSDEMIALLLSQFIIECSRCMSGSPTLPPKLPNPADDFETRPPKNESITLILDEQFLYKYATLTLTQLSNRLGFSPRHTQRLLGEIYGKSFSEKKLEARMAAAASLLKGSQTKITKISDDLGYSSIEHFSNAFSKYWGCSPRSYRQHHLLTGG